MIAPPSRVWSIRVKGLDQTPIGSLHIVAPECSIFLNWPHFKAATTREHVDISVDYSAWAANARDWGFCRGRNCLHGWCCVQANVSNHWNEGMKTCASIFLPPSLSVCTTSTWLSTGFLGCSSPPNM